jgi:hypothetical protein
MITYYGICAITIILNESIKITYQTQKIVRGIIEDTRRRLSCKFTKKISVGPLW